MIICIANQHQCEWKDYYQRFVCLTNPEEPSSQGEICAIDCSWKYMRRFVSDEGLMTSELFRRMYSVGEFAANSQFMLRMIMNSSKHVLKCVQDLMHIISVPKDCPVFVVQSFSFKEVTC